MNTKEEEEEQIQGFEEFLDKEVSKPNKQKESTLNNTNTLTKKRERENDVEKEIEKESIKAKAFLYSPDDNDNEIREESSSDEENCLYDNDFDNLFNKEPENEDERYEIFYDVSENKK